VPWLTIFGTDIRYFCPPFVKIGYEQIAVTAFSSLQALGRIRLLDLAPLVVSIFLDFDAA
jgi:hypothetical protein